MVYHRAWFHRDRFAFTLGGGGITNPGRYLVLMPPINGATAYTGSPYFTANDYMPRQFLTWRLEYNHRASNVPYFSGAGGVTPAGGNTGTPAVPVPGFTPDLRKYENRITIAVLVKM